MTEKRRRGGGRKRVKRPAQVGPPSKRPRLKPTSLWPLGFDEAIDVILKAKKPPA